MKESHQSTCPLCRSKADYVNSPHGGMFKYYSCDTCIHFEIQLGAENRLAALPPEFGLEYSKESRSLNETLMLSVFVNDDRELDAKPIPRSSKSY